jgi:SAM-dependent methyltransferase
VDSDSKEAGMKDIVSEFKTQHWNRQYNLHRSGFLKSVLYFFARPILSMIHSRELTKETINALKPTLCLRTRGLPLEDRRLWGCKFLDIRKSVILVQGTGTGWDIISWAKLRPLKIIAIDLFEFEESWEQIAEHCRKLYNVEVLFYQAPLENVSFIQDSTIDMIASDAVYEHCRNLSDVMKESFRILRSGGFVYATYGPLWYSAGGDHFSGRGGLQHCFNHILMDADEYKEYVNSYLNNIEDFQSGGRYIALDLFSYLTTSQYVKIFEDAGLNVQELIFEISSASIQFRKKFPVKFAQIVNRNADNCCIDDFLIKSNFVLLKKSNIAVA